MREKMAPEFPTPLEVNFSSAVLSTGRTRNPKLLTFVDRFAAGLPDRFFSNQKYQFGQILEGLRWENVEIFYGHLKYFTDIADI
jgi:hypothetical protein